MCQLRNVELDYIFGLKIIIIIDGGIELGLGPKSIWPKKWRSKIYLSPDSDWNPWTRFRSLDKKGKKL